ncbi:MAG TPA: triose-phosphate isomerase [bacterium]|nr:triose-phosphate isomerase [bacterium]
MVQWDTSPDGGVQTWIVGNWKMNGSLAQISAFVPALLAGLPAGWEARGVRIALCPPTPYLATMTQHLTGSHVELGAQKVHPLESGAFTGEVSPPMLADFSVSLCLVGHSENRQLSGESEVFIAEKLHGLFASGIRPILCVGETLEQRKAGQQEHVIQMQLTEAFSASSEVQAGRRAGDVAHLPHPTVSDTQAQRLIVAYEPVWAIGTGMTASPEQANEMHAFIRRLLTERFGAATAAEIPILYGGSVNPGNAGSLLSQREINGALVGGASLKAETFLPIIQQSLS